MYRYRCKRKENQLLNEEKKIENETNSYLFIHDRLN